MLNKKDIKRMIMPKTSFKKIETKIMKKFAMNYNSKTQKKIYEANILDALIYNKNCHLISLFNEYLIWDYIDEFLKREYTMAESIERLPKFAEFYKNYLTFFCAPIISDFPFNNLIQDHNEKKAEIFYNQNFVHKKGSKNDNHNNNNNFNIIENYNCNNTSDNSGNDFHNDEEDWFESRRGKDKNKKDILFNSSIRKKIETNSIITISNLCTNQNEQTITLDANDKPVVLFKNSIKYSNEITLANLMKSFNDSSNHKPQKSSSHRKPNYSIKQKEKLKNISSNSQIDLLHLANNNSITNKAMKSRNISLSSNHNNNTTNKLILTKSQTQNEANGREGKTNSNNINHKNLIKTSTINNIFKNFLHKSVNPKKKQNNYNCKNTLYFRNHSQGKDIKSIDNLFSHNILHQTSKSKFTYIKTNKDNSTSTHKEQHPKSLRKRPPKQIDNNIMKLAFSLLMNNNNFGNHSNCHSQRNYNKNNSFLRFTGNSNINSFKNVQNINININNNINITNNNKKSRNKGKSCEIGNSTNSTNKNNRCHFGSYTGNVLKKANLFNRNHSKTKPANIPFAQLFSSFNKIKIKAVSSIPQKKQSKNIIYHYNNKKV